jgi:hypothetical protein
VRIDQGSGFRARLLPHENFAGQDSRAPFFTARHQAAVDQQPI